MFVGTDLVELSGLVDRLAEVEDLSGWTDARWRTRSVIARREIDRLESFAAGLLAAVDDRRIPCGAGATSAPAWAQWHTGERWQEAKASLDAGRLRERLPLTAKA